MEENTPLLITKSPPATTSSRAQQGSHPVYKEETAYDDNMETPGGYKAMEMHRVTVLDDTGTQRTPQATPGTLKKESLKGMFGGTTQQTMLFGIMLLVNVLGPLSTEAQVPALQEIADDFNTKAKWVQLTITIYMLFFGASQLVFGTLSDTYGRRNTLIFGLVLYTGTNVGCALAPNILLLNVFRAFQAMGSGAGMVIVYAIARDVFDQDDRTKVLGILGGIRPIVIASSPVFGGTVTNFLGWRYIFWIIGGLSLALLILVVAMLPETRAEGTHVRTVAEYAATFQLLVRKRVFVGLVVISGAVYAGVFIMFNEFSFVFGSEYGFSEFVTGLFCGLIVFGLMVGSLTSVAMVRVMDPISVVLMGVTVLFGCGVILVLPLWIWGHVSFYWTLLPLFGYVMADGLMLPHLISTALEPFKKQAGTASALAGFWRFFSAAAIALVVSSSSTNHVLTLHYGMAAMALSALLMYGFTLFGSDASEFTRSRDMAMQEPKLRIGPEPHDESNIGLEWDGSVLSDD